MKNIISLPIKRGEFVAQFAGSGTVASSTPGGTILTITPPSGQRVRVTNLSTDTSGIITNATLSFDSLDILTSISISGQAPNSGLRYSIGNYQPYGVGAPPVGNHKFITGKIGEAFIVSTTSTTSGVLYYAYEFGE